MTEKQWLKCTDPTKMVYHVEGKVSHRKLRLFGCACCRRIWHLFDERHRHSLEVAERYADGLASLEELDAAHRAASSASVPDDAYTEVLVALQASEYATFPSKGGFPCIGGQKVAEAFAFDKEDEKRDWDSHLAREQRVQAKILRDIIGNPFRPVTLDDTWLTPAVTALAQSIYDDRRFEDMPILADALEEAGCMSDDILCHCRSGGVHVRGCWVVDLLLGKG